MNVWIFEYISNNDFPNVHTDIAWAEGFFSEIDTQPAKLSQNYAKADCKVSYDTSHSLRFLNAVIYWQLPVFCLRIQLEINMFLSMGTRNACMCIICVTYLKEKYTSKFRSPGNIFSNELRYFTWLMMSTDWDSLLQDLEIRYSKHAGIIGLLVVDMWNHYDVMTWRLSLRAGNLPIKGGGFPSHKASNTGLWWCFDACLNMIWS